MTGHRVPRWNTSGCVWRVFWDEAGTWLSRLSKADGPRWRGVLIQSIEGLNGTKSGGRRNLPHLLPACLLSWDIHLLLPSIWNLHCWLPWFLGLQTQTGATPPAFQVFSLQMAEHRTSQPPSSHEPVPRNLLQNIHPARSASLQNMDWYNPWRNVEGFCNLHRRMNQTPRKPRPNQNPQRNSKHSCPSTRECVCTQLWPVSVDFYSSALCINSLEKKHHTLAGSSVAGPRSVTQYKPTANLSRPSRRRETSMEANVMTFKGNFLWLFTLTQH